jgi:DNA-binding HxlR family transcriptional regulator
VVATLYREHGARFVELLNRLGASRDTLSETLADLMDKGVVMRNPGYGHPLRPEYILTPIGERVGAACVGVVTIVLAAETMDVALKKWPMIVLIALGRGGTRFNELKGCLPGITTRSLALALKELEVAHLVHRVVADAYPPSVTYRPTLKAALMLPALNGLADVCESLPPVK